MRNNSICVFVSEEDCPKNNIDLSCEECEANNLYEVIENALKDFVSLGEDFTEIFTLCKTLLKNNGTKVKVQVPVESIHRVARVVNSLLSKSDKTTIQEILYQRLIFHFFDIIFLFP